MNIKRTLPLIFLSTVLLALLSSVATARTARAIFLGATADSPTEATLVFAQRNVTIPLPSKYLSEEFRLPNGPLSAFVLAKKPARSGAEIDPSAPSVSFSEDSRRCYLLFMPDPSNEVFPVRVVVVDASADQFPEGHTAIFNFSNMFVKGEFGDQKVSIQPGENELIKPPMDEAGSYPVLISCRGSEESDWFTVSNTKWRYSPNVRQLVFITNEKSRKIPRMWSVIDRTED